MADQQVKILAFKASLEDIPDTLIPVRVAKTTVLPPFSETSVPCQSDVTNNTPLVLITQSPGLLDKSPMVTPAVISGGNVKLLIANPSSQPSVLYKGQTVSSASPLTVMSEGSLSEVLPCP